MGKVKRHKLKISRFSPTNGFKNARRDSLGMARSKFSIKADDTFSGEIQKCDNAGNDNRGLNAAQEKIQSAVTDEKIIGLNTIAAYALDFKAADSIAKSQTVSQIACLLMDDNSQVKLATAGVFRNLCSWGNEEIINILIQKNVLQPLTHLLKTYEFNSPSNDVNQEKSTLVYSKGVANSMEEADPHHLILIHAMHVLWSLCECNEEAMQLFNREGLVNVLLNHIDPFAWSFSISLAAADCLLCVSENNPKITPAILPYADNLLSLVHKSFAQNGDTFGLHLSVVLIGVLLNINYLNPSDANFPLVLDVLSKALEVDGFSFFQVKENGVNGSSKSSCLEQFEHMISAQLVALEILSNICCPDDNDDNEWEESEDHDLDLDLDSMDIEEECSSSLATELLEGIKHFDMVEKTHRKIMLAFPCAYEIPGDETKTIAKKFDQVQIRALQCFQNLVCCLTIDELGGPDKMYSTWIHLGTLAFSESSFPEENFMEASSGAMRAIIEKLSDQNYPKLLDLSGNELKGVFSSGKSCQTPPVRANVCRMVGTLGCCFIRNLDEERLFSPQCSEFLSAISEFLFQVSENDSILWVKAEALDVLIDLFSDDKTDKLAARIRLVERLKNIQSPFKAKYNQQKKRLGDHRALVLTVRDNLMAFIKYKGPRTKHC